MVASQSNVSRFHAILGPFSSSLNNQQRARAVRGVGCGRKKEGEKKVEKKKTKKKKKEKKKEGKERDTERPRTEHERHIL